MSRCAAQPSAMSLATLRRLSFIDWPSKTEAVKCSNLIDLMAAFVNPTGSDAENSLESSPKDQGKSLFTVEEAQKFIVQQQQQQQQ